MKKLLMFCVLAVASMVAMALPKPSQIEEALAARHYDEARGMVQEVLRERPDSARAHLLNAYLLEHVDHNLTAARAELQSATGLDKKGDVRSSALFGRVVGEMDAQAARAPVVNAPPAVAAPSVPLPQGKPFPWLTALIMLAVLAALVWLVCRAMRPRDVIVYGSRGDGYAGGAMSGPTTLVPGGGGSRTFYSAPPAAPAAAAPVHTGMTAGENFMATAGGVVAGNVLSDMLLHRHSHDDAPSRRREEAAPAYEPTPAYSPSPVSYEAERASFSSSSSGSDSWGSSSSSSSSSDSWSSSDSGSSSSDW